jgi:anti-anti-sigma factor
LVRARRDVLLHLSGELDRESRDAFDACVASVLAEQPRRLVLDLSGLSSVDLVGVGCFSDAQRSAELAGVQLVLDSPNEMVLAMLDGADAGRAFSIR